MLAISTLENDGTTEAELDDLARIRKLPSESSFFEGSSEIKNIENEETSESLLFEKERPLTRDNRPPNPFKSRVRREDSDEDDFNPFEDIATRPPPTTVSRGHKFLTRNQIVGVAPSRFVHHYGTPHQGEMSQQGWVHPRRRKPYINIDWSKPLIVQLPLPPQ